MDSELFSTYGEVDNGGWPHSAVHEHDSVRSSMRKDRLADLANLLVIDNHDADEVALRGRPWT